MRQLIAALCALCTLGVMPAWSMAQGNSQEEIKDATPNITPAIGARVGGYGFRQLNSNNNVDWNNCRMNGVGVWGTVDLTRNLFAELSADMYYATGETLKSGIDRLSMHSLAAVGVRLVPDFLISPYIQLGGGVEYTWVEVYGHKGQGFKPIGFVGIGGEINLDPFKLGMAIRSNAMQLPVYDWDEGHGEREVSYRTEFAGQALFSLRYLL